MLALNTFTSAVLARGLRSVHGYSRIGNRDVVGHGCNGIAAYKDDAHFPFPAIRFKENNQHLDALREKEMDDWRQLSRDEKKALYRASFCQTFAEFQCATGQWKIVLGGVFFVTSFAFWIQMLMANYVRDQLPDSLSVESQKAQLCRMLELHVNPIDGLASKWDYSKAEWK